MALYLHPYFLQNLSEIHRLCEQWKIEELYFFGSAVNGRFMPGTSDLDILVKTDRAHISHLVPFGNALRELCACKVDVLHTDWPLAADMAEHLATGKLLVYQLGAPTTPSQSGSAAPIH